MNNKGRPAKTDKVESTKMMSFRADKETEEAIVELTAAVAGEGLAAGRRRSIAIRRALLEARDRLRQGSKM